MLEQIDALLGPTAQRGDPFLGGGDAPSVSDLMLLPFLERAEAVVPYFFGEAALASMRFGRVERYLRQVHTAAHTCMCTVPAPGGQMHPCSACARYARLRTQSAPRPPD